MPSSDDAEGQDDADETLMRRYADGDAAAFERLYTRHEMAVWRFVRRSVRQQSVADELLQDVWFAVARQAGHYRPRQDARFRTWLFTIARNRVIDHFRSSRNETRIDETAADGEGAALADTLVADSGFDPLRRIESREQAAALLAAVEQLPLAQREAFLLQAEAGMRVDEIAQATGVMFETAKSRLRYAREQLRRSLREFA